MLEIVPSGVDQATPSFGLFITVAVNWTAAPEYTFLFVGAITTTMERGVMLTLAEADLVGSAMLPAITVVVVFAVTWGAV